MAVISPHSLRVWLASKFSPRDHGGPVRWIGSDTVIRERDRQFLILAMAVKANRGRLPENLAGVLYEFDATDILRYIDNHDIHAADYGDIRDALDHAPNVEYDLNDGEYRVVDGDE